MEASASSLPSLVRSDDDDVRHPFEITLLDATVIEIGQSKGSCEGSDSGVDVLDSATLHVRPINASQELFEGIATSTPSCDSSLVSCCSNYEDAFNVLVRRNSTLLDDYRLRTVDGTSENGSESSSLGSTTKLAGVGAKRHAAVINRKKVTLEKSVTATSPATRTKPPTTPRLSSRTKSTERTPAAARITPKAKPPPDYLNLKKEAVSATTQKKQRTPSQTRSNISTPTDDGRWPSNYSRPTPAMTRSLRGILPLDVKPKEAKNTLEKYATLPRRRREAEKSEASGRDSSATRSTPPAKTITISFPSMSPKVKINQSCGGGDGKKKKKLAKIPIFQETACQTVLDGSDITKALSGVSFHPANPQAAETDVKHTQVDLPDEKFTRLQEQYTALASKCEALLREGAERGARFKDTEIELAATRAESEDLKRELRTNNERVASMLDCCGVKRGNDDQSDNLFMLESRLQRVSQIIVKQEAEIAELNDYCRTLRRDVDARTERNRTDAHHRQEQDDLLEFLQIEKTSLSEALKEAEAEVQRTQRELAAKEHAFEEKHDECKHLVRANEQKRQEHLGLQARYTALEAKCRELLVHQGSTVSGAAVAVTSLNARLESLVDQLTTSYNFTDEDLDDLVFHNEAYSNSTGSSADNTPDRPGKIANFDKVVSPKRGSSFIAAVMNAIRNATTAPTFHRDNSRDTITDNSDSGELLDSETEPCLMMEHVLEDVVLPDSHSVNMISSGHGAISLRLSHAESLNSLSQAIRNRERCEAAAAKTTSSDLAAAAVDSSSPVSLVDQVIDADNLLTRLLKIIRIIQTENDEYMNELQDERDSYAEQVHTHRESNKIVMRQLQDWEHLGAKLKCEVKELLAQLAKRTLEIDEIKAELNAQRAEFEKSSRDVCALSTALAKAEWEMRTRDDEVTEALRDWESGGGEMLPSGQLLGRILALRKEVPALREKLDAKEKQLGELHAEHVANRQVLTENLREAIAEAKKQYNAIDNALEMLQSIQSVVQQCPTLRQLQHDLEEASFRSASAMPLVVPPDFNANAAAILQAMGNLAAPINSSA